jgi:hypothetical protein
MDGLTGKTANEGRTKLTIEKVKQIKGYEKLSDSEAKRILEGIQRLAAIIAEFWKLKSNAYE